MEKQKHVYRNSVVWGAFPMGMVISGLAMGWTYASTLPQQNIVLKVGEGTLAVIYGALAWWWFREAYDNAHRAKDLLRKEQSE